MTPMRPDDSEMADYGVPPNPPYVIKPAAFGPQLNHVGRISEA